MKIINSIMNKNSFLNKLLVIIFIFPIFVYSQEEKHQETVNVIGEFAPQLAEARKIGFSPKAKDTVIEKSEVNYRVNPISFDVKFDVRPIPPAKMLGESFIKLYKNHLIAGMGNYWSPFIEYTHHSYRNKNFRGNIYMKHLSANGNFDDYAFPGYSDNAVGLFGSRINREYVITSKIDYLRSGFHYYGFMPDSSIVYDFENSDIKQVFHKLDAIFRAESKFNDASKFHNDVQIAYQGLWDNFNVNENNILLSGNLKKNINTLSFLKDEKILVEANGGFFNQNYDLQSLSTGIASIKPYINFKLDNTLEFSVGANVSAQIDSVGEAIFFPYGKIDIHIVPNSLRIFLGIDGKLEKNTFRSIVDVNEFVNTQILPMEFTKTNFMLFGGINGGFGGKFNYRIMAKNRSIENLALFVNDTLPILKDEDVIAKGTRFDIIYEDIDILSFSAEMDMKFNSKFEMFLKAEYHMFSPKNEAQAWHIPLYNGIISAIYNIDKKIYAKLNFFTYGQRYALLNNEEIKLAPIYDFNIEFEYRYSKLLSGFVKFNNFTTQRHYYWNKYPSQRLNFILGATYTF